MLGNASLIDSLDALIGAAQHGKLHRFTVARESGRTPYEIELLLRRYGIRVWGREPDRPDDFSFQVNRRQAVWAEYVMCRADVPVVSPLLDPQNRVYSARHANGSMPTPWDPLGIGPQGLVDFIVDWLAKI